MTTEELDITIEIMCTQLPAAGQRCLHLGIQCDNEITECASTDAKRIVFKPILRARRSSDGSVNFLGPFAQGPKTERFIYLNWVMAKEKKGRMDMIGRIKLHLNHITWAAVEKAVQSNRPIRVKLSLTNAKGTPVMASVRPDVAQWE